MDKRGLNKVLFFTLTFKKKIQDKRIDDEILEKIIKTEQ